MWLIEFISGHLNGVTLPLKSKLCLTGDAESDLHDVLSLPEYWPADVSLTFETDGNHLYVMGFCRNEKRKLLIANHVYEHHGLAFFLYPLGQRMPKMRRYRLSQYKLLILISVMINITLILVSLAWWKTHQTELIENYWGQIKSGYIKGNRLYVYNEDSLKGLPQYLRANITVIEPSSDLILSQLSVELVSDETGNQIVGSVKSKEGRDQIRVHTKEVDNKIMSLLGRVGVNFIKDGSIWKVSDVELASRELKAHGLSNIVNQIQPRDDYYEYIDAESFPYSIFYSNQSARYIYDNSNRYWEGSLVPNLGEIDTITSEKVVFKDGSKIRIYQIPYQ